MKQRRNYGIIKKYIFIQPFIQPKQLLNFCILSEVTTLKKILILLMLCLTALLLIPLSAAASSPGLYQLPAALNEIGAEAFMGNLSVEKVIVPDGVTRIGPRAFASSGLRKIFIPPSVSSIDSTAFDDCFNFERAYVNYDSYAANWCLNNGISVGFRSTIRVGFNNPLIEHKGSTKLYTFVPTKSGIYTLKSDSSYDTVAYLYDASLTQIDYDDDSGENRNFQLSHYFTAGSVYYFEVRFYSSSDTGSIPLTLSAASTPSPVTSTKYRALLIGNENYAGGKLSGTINDASAMRMMLSGLSNTFSCTQRNDLTASGIKNAISSAFSGASGSDVSLFFYAGHGAYSSNTSYLGALVGINDNSSDILTTAALAAELNKIPGRIIVILDSCHSGASINRAVQIQDENLFLQDTQAALDAFNQSVIDAFAAYDSTVIVDGDVDDEYLMTGELATSKFVVITACTSTQNAASQTVNGQSYGAFTRSFVEGCGADYFYGTYNGSMPADTSRDNQLTVNEIYTYARNQATSRNSGQTAQCYAANTSEVLFRR